MPKIANIIKNHHKAQGKGIHPNLDALQAKKIQIR
jgi:hypothetical protein